jgi:hypothetical protein
MAKKIGGFSAGIGIHDLAFSDEQISGLAAKAKVNFGAEANVKLRSLIKRCAEDREIWDKGPRPKQLEEALAKFVKATAAYGSKLDALTGGSEAATGEALAHSLSWSCDAFRLPELRLFLGQLQARAGQIQRRLTIEVGASGVPWREGFIRELYSVYQSAGGNARVSSNAGVNRGPFFDLVVAALKLAGAPAEQSNGIRNAIVKALPPKTQREKRES